MVCHGPTEGMAHHRNETVFVRLVHPRAYMPTRGADHSAGLDLIAPEPGVIPYDGLSHNINIGVQLVLPIGHVGKIEARSGLASRGIAAHAGVID